MLAAWKIALLVLAGLLIIVVAVGFAFPVWYTVGKKDDNNVGSAPQDGKGQNCDSKNTKGTKNGWHVVCKGGELECMNKGLENGIKYCAEGSEKKTILFSAQAEDLPDWPAGTNLLIQPSAFHGKYEISYAGEKGEATMKTITGVRFQLYSPPPSANLNYEVTYVNLQNDRNPQSSASWPITEGPKLAQNSITKRDLVEIYWGDGNSGSAKLDVEPISRSWNTADNYIMIGLKVTDKDGKPYAGDFTIRELNLNVDWDFKKK